MSDRLYNLLPAVYRLRDAEQAEPLRALLSIVQQEYDAVEDNIAGLYENWFIETCDDWVIPYIGDLLGVRPVYPASPGTFSARAFIAHTIGYRRRKGTAAMLEQLARDVTGWPARAVEFFQLLSTSQYLNHLRPQNQATASLRNASRLELLGGPFDTVTRSADVRHISSGRGRYNIPSLGLFLWRLQDYFIGRSDARAAATPADGRYYFHPLGSNAPLFNRPQTETEAAQLAQEINVPGPLRRRPLYDELESLRQSEADNVPPPAPVYFGANPVLQILVNGSAVPFDQVMICDIADSGASDWRRPPSSKKYTPTNGGAAVTKPIALSVDPVRGRIAFPTGAAPASVQVSYVYAFSGDLGAGPYDRAAWLQDPATMPGPLGNPHRWQAAVSHSLPPVAGLVFASFDEAIQAWNAKPAGTDGVITILDSLSYREDPRQIEIPEASRLLIVAADWPAVRHNPVANNSLDANGLRPHLQGQLKVHGSAPAASTNPGQLFIDGLLIEGGIAVAAGNLGTLALSHSTIARAAALNAAANDALAVVIYRAICGAVSLNASVPSLNATDSIIARSIAAPGTAVEINASTIFGTTAARMLNAGNSIFNGIVSVERQQTGCMRFCYVPDGSTTPRRYRCQPDLALAGITRKAVADAIRARLTPQFTSLDFSHPAYAQLSSACAAEISTGADQDAEMGAFHFLQQPQRRANLKAALDEYLRFGLEAGAVDQT